MKRPAVPASLLNACSAARAWRRGSLLGALCCALVACATPAPSADRVVVIRPAFRSAAPPRAVLPVTVASAPARAEPEWLEIVAGGDVSFGREVGQKIVSSADYAPFAAISPLLSGADVRFVNLESQLSDQGGETQSPRHRLIFTGPPEGARTLSAAGIHVVSTANNHAWDYGFPALLETLAHLRVARVQSVGTGPDLDAAYRPATLTVKGVRVAIFALTHIWNQGPIERHEGRDYVAWANLGRLRRELSAARRANDVVLVSYHGGAEYQDAPSELTRAFCKAAIEAGADAVIGHHPHVIQGIGWTDARPIFYSLGNLVFGRRPEHPWTRYGMLARLRFGPDGARKYSVCPYRIDEFEPAPLSADARDAQRLEFSAHLKLASTAVGGIELGASDALGCIEVAKARRALSPSDLPAAGRAARRLAAR